MSHYFTRVGFLVFFAIIFFARHNVAAEESPRKKEIESVVSAKSLEDMVNRYILMFLHASDSEVEQLTTHENPGVAFSAAWESVQRTNKKAPTESMIRPDGGKLHWFIGFVEGRLNMVAPKFWKKTLLSVRVTNDFCTFYKLSFDEMPLHKTDSRYLATPGIAVKNHNGELVISVGDKTFQIKESQLTEKRSYVDVITAIVDGDRAYVASYPLHGDSCEIVCYSLSEKKVLWKNDVWVELKSKSVIMRIGPPGYQWTVMALRNNKLFVFGIGFRVAYIEAFDATAGDRLFVFNTDTPPSSLSLIETGGG